MTTITYKASLKPPRRIFLLGDQQSSWFYIIPIGGEYY
jgi:hypothetical protein